MTFDAVVDIKEGSLIIPRTYREALIALAKQGHVQITIRAAESTTPQLAPNIDRWHETHETLLAYLLDNPISTHEDMTADEPIRMTREALHER